MQHIIYLHGFLSGPRAGKAEQLREYMETQGLGAYFHAPALPVDPLTAILHAEAEIIDLDFAPFLLVGSSLGGFYATVLAEKWNAPAVLINPAVRPYERAQHFVGVHTHYHSGETVIVKPDFPHTLAGLEPDSIQADRYWLLTCTEDETLDAQAGIEYYAGCRQSIEQGGNHAFPMFANYLEEIVNLAKAGA